MGQELRQKKKGGVGGEEVVCLFVLSWRVRFQLRCVQGKVFSEGSSKEQYL